jgi:hypothetical protein
MNVASTSRRHYTLNVVMDANVTDVSINQQTKIKRTHCGPSGIPMTDSSCVSHRAREQDFRGNIATAKGEPPNISENVTKNTCNEDIPSYTYTVY